MSTPVLDYVPRLVEARGWWSGFRWAFDMLELRTALEDGPVVIGIQWHDSMYDAPGGVVNPYGRVVGGHCLLITGYTRHHRKLNSSAWRLRNSWGRDWGHNGQAYIDDAALGRLVFGAGGEAAVPVNRA